MKKFIFFIIFFIVTSVSLAASEPSVIRDWRVDGDVNSSYIIPTNSFLKESTGNDFMISPEIRASFSFGEKSKYGRMYHNVRQGLALRQNFIAPNSSLSNPTDLFVFQSVRLAGSKQLSLDAEWNFGVSFGWSKFDPSALIINTAIGSRTNAILGVGLTANYRLDNRWTLKAGINATHYSNGNTHLPNAGVNNVGLLIGAGYTLDDSHTRPSDAYTPVEPFRRGFSYDVTIYGAGRQRIAVDDIGDYVALKGSFGVAGLNAAAMYDLNRYFRFGVSTDAQYDESANLADYRVEGTIGDDVKFYRPPFYKGLAVGMSLRGEVTLPVFSINFGVGRNVIAFGPDTRVFYQTLALKTYVWRGAFLQVGYQLSDFHRPSNLMLGLGYTFGKK